MPDNLDGYLNFYSVSGDGRVTNWTLVRCSLWFTDKFLLEFPRQLENCPPSVVADNITGTPS